MVEITENKKIKLTAFILSKTKILDSLFENFEKYENMPLEVKENLIKMTCNFIKEYIDDNARNQGGVWYIGYVSLIPYDRLEICENYIINISDIEKAVSVLNNRFWLEYYPKYELKIDCKR